MLGPMSLTALLNPPLNQRPPTLLKIGVWIQIVLLFPLLARGLDFIGTIAVQAAILIALLNMKRWAVLALGVAIVATLIAALNKYGLERGAAGILFGFTMRMTAFIPAVLFWERMDWRGWSLTPRDESE